MPTESVTLEYYFDPFCGWCYASAPALDALAEAYPQTLRMRPSGLFANTGGQPVSSMAEHSWRTGQRIATMTGQTYTTEYRDRVLHNPDGIFDSIYPTRAIMALGEIDHLLEPKLLHALQTARDIDGKDTSRAEVVAPIAAEVAGLQGHKIEAAAFAERLVKDQALARRTDATMQTTVEDMRALSGTGVPQLLVVVGDHCEVVDGADLYGGGARVLRAIDAVMTRAAVDVH